MKHRLSRLVRLVYVFCAVTGAACATTQVKNQGDVPSEAAPAKAVAPSPPEECVWSFAQYEPSQWEREWFEGEKSGERRDRECEVLATAPEVDRSVRLVRSVQGAVLDRKPIPQDSIELFSRMVYAERCGTALKDSGRRRAQLIEPLVGIVRDPLTMCPRAPGIPDEVYNSFQPDEGSIQARRQLLIGIAAPWSETPSDPASWHMGGFEPYAAAPRGDRPRARLNFLVDMGASTYGQWGGDKTAVGAAWFVERNKRHNLAFDWIVSFEYDKIDPETIYKSVPDDVLPHYIYFDRPVEKNPSGKWNPWRILRGMGANSEDYVVVKIDIDSPDIENPLIDQLVEERGLRGLVDEVFIEHHVNTKVMNGYWGTGGSKLTMKDTYQKFTTLRSNGVRMHSWP